MTNEQHVERWYRRQRQRPLFYASVIALPLLIYVALGISTHNRTGEWPRLSDMVDDVDREYGRR